MGKYVYVSKRIDRDEYLIEEFLKGNAAIIISSKEQAKEVVDFVQQNGKTVFREECFLLSYDKYPVFFMENGKELNAKKTVMDVVHKYNPKIITFPFEDFFGKTFTEYDFYQEIAKFVEASDKLQAMGEQIAQKLDSMKKGLGSDDWFFEILNQIQSREISTFEVAHYEIARYLEQMEFYFEEEEMEEQEI